MRINHPGENDKQLGQVPSPQTHGHNVDLNVSFNPQTSKVVCHVQPSTKSGGKVAATVMEESAARIQEISVDVSGGKEAPGQTGQDGVPGRNGWDGRDATHGEGATTNDYTRLGYQERQERWGCALLL